MSQESLDVSPQVLEDTIPKPTPHPATIPGLRETPLNPTSLTIKETYTSTSTYTSYRASYTSDGLTIYGLLTIPKETPPPEGFPAIVFLHGYIPPAQYRTPERYVSYVDGLAKSGFIVFKIDYRGHDESEGEAGGGYFSPGYVRDTLHAVSALRQDTRVNAQAIGLWGHSMSGNIALRSAVVDRNIQALVVWGGAVFSYEDRIAYGLNDNSFVRQRDSEQNIISRSRAIIEEYGEFSSTSPFWQQMAPTNYLSDLNTAIQLHHAENDSVVNANYSRDLQALLESAEKTHEVYFYPSGGHDLEGTSFTPAMERTVEFFREHLRAE